MNFEVSASGSGCCSVERCVFFYERNLKESISTINEKIRKLKPEYQEAESVFRKTMTWMKFTIFKISIRNNTNRIKEKIAETHRKKLDKLLVDKAV